MTAGRGVGQALRELVRRRASGACEYCRVGEDVDFHTFHVEHVVPRQHGGATAADNLALACVQCNLHKGPNLTGIDPLTNRVVRLFDPRAQAWDEHFERLAGGAVAGRTACGRATVRVLDMNDPDRLQARAASQL